MSAVKLQQDFHALFWEQIEFASANLHLQDGMTYSLEPGANMSPCKLAEHLKSCFKFSKIFYCTCITFKISFITLVPQTGQQNCARKKELPRDVKMKKTKNKLLARSNPRKRNTYRRRRRYVVTSSVIYISPFTFDKEAQSSCDRASKKLFRFCCATFQSLTYLSSQVKF